MEGSLETLASGQEGWKPQACLPAPGWRMRLHPPGSGNFTARPLPLPVLCLGSRNGSRNLPFLLLATSRNWRLRGRQVFHGPRAQETSPPSTGRLPGALRGSSTSENTEFPVCRS